MDILGQGLHVFSLNHGLSAPPGFHPDCGVEMHISAYSHRQKVKW